MRTWSVRRDIVGTKVARRLSEYMQVYDAEGTIVLHSRNSSKEYEQCFEAFWRTAGEHAGVHMLPRIPVRCTRHGEGYRQDCCHQWRQLFIVVGQPTARFAQDHWVNDQAGTVVVHVQLSHIDGGWTGGDRRS